MQESWASSEAARKTMQGNRSRDTKPEMAVRRIVHARGLRYRVNTRPEKDVRRTADLVFAHPRVAVFIDGCFWHGCPYHFVMPTTNGEFWSTKITHNRERDADTRATLEDRGWIVLRFWEHEAAVSVADRIIKAVRGDEPGHAAGRDDPAARCE